MLPITGKLRRVPKPQHSVHNNKGEKIDQGSGNQHGITVTNIGEGRRSIDEHGSYHEEQDRATELAEDVEEVGGGWQVKDVGVFSRRAEFRFDGDHLPDGLRQSDHEVYGSDPGSYNRYLDPANVSVNGGFLNLKVPGGQVPSGDNNYTIGGAEVTTVEHEILYASVRTHAILSSEPGTCHGMFYYKDDTQETDIEYLTDPDSYANFGPDQPIPLWYTNQATNPDVRKTSEYGVAPIDCTTEIHEYRLDWTKDFTAFYVDGTLHKRFTTNVPSVPAPWKWNNWSNGLKDWSSGPPALDSVFRIQEIKMYYNTASDIASTESTSLA